MRPENLVGCYQLPMSPGCQALHAVPEGLVFRALPEIREVPVGLADLESPETCGIRFHLASCKECELL